MKYLVTILSVLFLIGCEKKPDDIPYKPQLMSVDIECYGQGDTIILSRYHLGSLRVDSFTDRYAYTENRIYDNQMDSPITLTSNYLLPNNEIGINVYVTDGHGVVHTKKISKVFDYTAGSISVRPSEAK